MHKVKGVVSKGKNQPVSVETILVPDPGPGEALVDVLTCGVCQTDLHYKVGPWATTTPTCSATRPPAWSPRSARASPRSPSGDKVILNWRAVCGECRACRRGEPWYCFATHNATQKMTLADGTALSPALGIGAFAEKTLVAAGQCTKIEAELETAPVRRGRACSGAA